MTKTEMDDFLKILQGRSIEHNAVCKCLMRRCSSNSGEIRISRRLRFRINGLLPDSSLYSEKHQRVNTYFGRVG